MKLNVSELEAGCYATLFASFFVLSVYVWKPFAVPPPEIKALWNKKYLYLRGFEKQMIEFYEMRMRIQSVTTLSFMAFLFLVLRSNLDERPDVWIL